VTDEARIAPTRRLLGLVLCGLAGVALVLFVLGSWNPWRLVWLSHYFGSPPVGLTVVMGLLCVGSWLAFPVLNEATGNARIMFRIVTALGTVFGVALWGVIGPIFTTKIEIMAQTPDGERTVALVERSDRSRLLHVWQGAGLLARDVGILGQACGEVTITFVSRDQIHLTTSYGDWSIDLDPVTGAPRQVLGPRCADGPQPATLER
jgi:hypothetical protein